MSDHVTCLGCGCACDDIHLRVLDARIVEAQNACALGAAWFGDGSAPSRVRVGGRDAAIDEALDEVVRLLARAARPLVYIAPDISCETQRVCVAIADALHATLDHVTSHTALTSILAAQERGRASATLGEVRNRADVVVFWGVDPDARYPRFATRYVPAPAGVHVPDGRRSRLVFAVDVGDSRGPADADRRIAVPADDEVEALTLLKALVAGSQPHSDSSEIVSGARHLADTLLAARYAAIVADAEPDGDRVRDALRPNALIAAAQALNARTRCALITLRAGGNRCGAEMVATAHTGYPLAIDFSRGAPRYRPAASGGAVEGDFDAVLVIGAADALPAEVVERWESWPLALIGPRASDSRLAHAGIVVDTAVAGIHEAGTAIRMDDVPLPLSAAVEGPRATRDVAGALLERVRGRPRAAETRGRGEQDVD